MKICVLNGSPKGEKSVTMQYVRFLEMAEPEHAFFVLSIGQKIKSLEKDADAWNALCETVIDADFILWATPVYFLHVPSQLKEFIELVQKRQACQLFDGKYTAGLTTSVKFFDNLAHEYLHGISEDLGMKWVGSFSAETSDLLQEQNQIQLVAFGDDICKACRENRPVAQQFLPVPGNNPPYLPVIGSDPVITGEKKVLILHDAPYGSNLEGMVRQMTASLKGDVTIAHLDEMGMKGGCLGCVQCAFDNQCVYKDGYISFWENHIPVADIIVYAGTIQDRYLSAQWKRFFDRSFYLGHVPRIIGKQVIYLIQGPLLHIPGLRENLTTLVSFNRANLVNIITDEDTDSGNIDRLIRSAAEQAVDYAKTGYKAPRMFPAEAGHKILRDAIWGDLWPIFQADDRYFKTHGLYDFPQKQYRKRIHNQFMSLFLRIPGVQSRVKHLMKDNMIKGFSRVFKDNKLLNERKRKLKVQ